MSTRDVRGEFSDVDQAADPSHFVRFLDAVSALDFIRAYKRRTYELLRVQPGDVVLDVGCGQGNDVREIARLVGPTGRVVGVDRSETLIAAAHERHEAGLPAEYQFGDAYQLAFANNTFAGCRADRVFHHLEHPERALAELVRVAKPGSMIVAADPDFETAIVDAPDRALTRTLLNVNCDGYQRGWMGRQLPALYQNAGLTQMVVEPLNVLLTSYAEGNQILALEGAVARAQLAGIVSVDEGNAWLDQLRQADRAGRFFAGLTAFIISGRTP